MRNYGGKSIFGYSDVLFFYRREMIVLVWVLWVIGCGRKRVVG